jgi:site-specific recombinase XerC
VPQDFFERLAADKRLRGNPLVPHLASFAASLQEDGYATFTMQSKLGLLADFAQWLGRRGSAPTGLAERQAAAFVNSRKRKHRIPRGAQETLRQFLAQLRKRGTVPAPIGPICDNSRRADILSRYEKHLRSGRGLAPATIVNYVPFARKLLVERFQKREILLERLPAADISAFVLRPAHTRGCRRAQLMTTAFRSFFRFLFQSGELQTDLARAVPAVADGRLSTVPKYLVPDQVERVVGSCNRQTSTGRRDYAILLLLARLGLRAGEIVALQLDDIDWRAGEILVRGQGLLHDRMPLPVDVGKAPISAWIAPNAKRVGCLFAGRHRGLVLLDLRQ